MRSEFRSVFDHRNSDLLLHTWSLAVEEQFYILFPIFLLVVRRFFPTRLRAAVVSLFAVSLAVSAVVVWKRPETAFYMPYTRAWELLLGTILSLKMIPAMRSQWVRNGASLLGLALIAIACLKFTSLTPFPGPAALLPCVGAGLIIAAGMSGGSVVYSLLSLRPVVFIGLISYSLYLWHWPVLMVYRMGLIDSSAWFERHFGNRFPVDRFDHIVVVVISFVLATLSWKYIENPFRKGRLRLSRRPLFASAVGVAAGLCGFAVVALSSQGLPTRFDANALRPAEFLNSSESSKDESLQRLGECFVDATTKNTSVDYSRCLRRDQGKQNFLLLGDSHAAALYPALRDSLPNVNLMQVNVTACPATIGTHRGAVCNAVMNFIFQSYLPEHPVDQLLLEADWKESDLPALDRTLAWATEHHVRVTVFGCVPEYDAPLARLLAYSEAWNRPGLPDEHRIARDAALDRELRSEVENKWHFRFVSLYDALCRSGRCIEYADAQNGIPLMSDSHHFNRFGAHFVVSRVMANGALK